MKKFILSVIMLSLIAAPFKTQAIETITAGVTNNATLAASAGAFVGGLGILWFSVQGAKIFSELEAGKEIDMDLLKGNVHITSTKKTTAKGLFNVLKNTLGLISCGAIWLKACYYFRENVFNKKIEPNALSPIDAACLIALYPAFGQGIPALISAIQDCDAADKFYDEYDQCYGNTYSRQANKEFKLFTGATAMAAVSLLVKVIADKALNTSVEKVVA